MRLVKQTFRISIKELGKKAVAQWPIYCKLAISYINKKRFTDINYSRHQLFFGTDTIKPNTLFSLDDNENDPIFSFLKDRDFLITKCRKIKLQQISEKPHSHIQNPFEKGQIVFMKSHVKSTLNDQYTGPFRILEKHNQGVQLLDLSNNKITLSHHRYLKPFDLKLYDQTFSKNVLDNFSQISARQPKSTTQPSKYIPPTDRQTRSMKSNTNIIHTSNKPQWTIKQTLFNIDTKTKNQSNLPKNKTGTKIIIPILPKPPAKNNAKISFKDIYISYFDNKQAITSIKKFNRKDFKPIQ